MKTHTCEALKYFALPLFFVQIQGCKRNVEIFNKKRGTKLHYARYIYIGISSSELKNETVFFQNVLSLSVCTRVHTYTKEKK